LIKQSRKRIYKKYGKYSKEVIFLDFIKKLVAEIADFVSIRRVV